MAAATNFDLYLSFLDYNCDGDMVIRILIGFAIIIGILGCILAVALIVDRWAERKEQDKETREEEDYNGFS